MSFTFVNSRGYETTIPESNHVMPSLKWLEEAWDAQPGEYGWFVGQVDGYDKKVPGSLQVALLHYGWFARRGWGEPGFARGATEMQFYVEQIGGLTPEQNADLAVWMGNQILDKIRAEMPRKTDVNGLSNVKRFGRGIEHA